MQYGYFFEITLFLHSIDHFCTLELFLILLGIDP